MLSLNPSRLGAGAPEVRQPPRRWQMPLKLWNTSKSSSPLTTRSARAAGAQAAPHHHRHRATHAHRAAAPSRWWRCAYSPPASVQPSRPVAATYLPLPPGQCHGQLIEQGPARQELNFPVTGQLDHPPGVPSHRNADTSTLVSTTSRPTHAPVLPLATRRAWRTELISA